jgi:hypothetical protein
MSASRRVERRHTFFFLVLFPAVGLLSLSCEQGTQPTSQETAGVSALAKPSGTVSYSFVNETEHLVTALYLKFNVPLTELQREASNVGLFPVTNPDIIGDWTVGLFSGYDSVRFPGNVIEYAIITATGDTRNLRLEAWQLEGPHFTGKLNRNCNGRNGCSIVN